jgi:Chaperone of endosialidase
MKKQILLFLIVFMSFNLAKGQINMASDGSVGIAGAINASWTMFVNGMTGRNNLGVTTPSGTVGSLIYGISSSFTNSTSGSSNRAINGSVYNTTAASSGQAYGVFGLAGNCTNGYNYGLFGQITGTNSGSAIMGYTGSSFVAPSDLTVASIQYAGYFMGNVKITGSIWAASGTITGSDERIKKEITVLNSSDNLFNLKPKQYKLKSQNELLNEFKTTSDTAKANNTNIPDSEENKKLHYGFLAQDIQQVYPDLVYTSPDGTLGIDYQGFIPMIIDQLQKTKQTSQAKDNQLNDLENRVAKLENQVIDLQNALEKCCNILLPIVRTINSAS